MFTTSLLPYVQSHFQNSCFVKKKNEKIADFIASLFRNQIGTILDIMVRMDRIRGPSTATRTFVHKRFVDPLTGCRGIDHGMTDGDFQKEFCSHPKRYLAKAISYRECRKNDINENAEFNNDGISDYRLVYIDHIYEPYEMSHKILFLIW